MQPPWMARSHDSHRPFLIIAIGLIGLAWLSLVIWGMSPYNRYLSHDAVDLILSSSGVWVSGLFITGWTLMIIAMMLPTSLPLIGLFRTVIRSHPERNWLVVMLIAGYMAIWILFGVMVHAADLGLHQITYASGTLSANTWLFAAGVFAVAGLYQFTELKYRCLDKCRSPLSFVSSYWRGHREWRNSFVLGVHHGIFCVGCCWSLMLLMFAVGHANIAWMFLLGVVMGAEKNLPWGKALAKPLGFGLIGGAVLIAAAGLYA